MKKFALMLFALLLFAPLNVVASQDIEISDNGLWGYIEDVDPITDEDTSAVLINIEDQRRGGLVVQCEGSDRVSVAVNFGTYVGSASESFSSVTYRFMNNDGEHADPVDSRWSQSTNGIGLFVPPRDRQAFIETMVKYDGLAIRTHDHRGSPETIEFDLTGEDGFLSRLSCVDFLDDEEDE